MGAIGPGINSTEEVLEFPIKRRIDGGSHFTKETRSWAHFMNLTPPTVDNTSFATDSG